MAFVSLPAGFNVGTPDPIDNRLVLSKAQMKAVNPVGMPDVYLTICKDDGKIYLFNKTNEDDSETGKFRLFDVDSVLSTLKGKEGVTISEPDSTGSRWVSIDTSNMTDDKGLYVYNKKSAWVKINAGTGIEISDDNTISSYVDVKYDDGLINFLNSKLK